MTNIGNEPEGATPLDPNELDGLKFKHITTRDQLNELEQANIESGLLWLGRRRKTDILTEEFTLELHRQLFGDVWTWAGQFRKTGKTIGVAAHDLQVHLRMLLDDARFWVERGTYSPLEAGARFHHRMVSIHPFSNGNGRHARIAADTYLTDRFDHTRINWAAGYDLQRNNERRTSYIAALRAADRGDYGPLLVFAGAKPKP
jgi:Fic-DOC domain mobile mystery protein B